jgi:hypothetical protein
MLDGLYQILNHAIALKLGKGCKLMCDAMILTNFSKFFHPLTTIICQNVLKHSIPVDNLIF